MNVQKIQNPFLRAYNLACYLKILLLVLLVITFQSFGTAQQVLFCISQVLFTVYTAVYGLTAKIHCPAHKIELLKNLIFEVCLMMFSIVGACLAFIGIREFDGSISDESSLASVLCTIGVIFLILSFWLHENFILVWYYTKFMVQNICSLFRNHAKVAVVGTPEQPQTPHGAQATPPGPAPFTPPPGINTSPVFIGTFFNQVTTGDPTPQIPEGLLRVEKQKKVSRKPSENQIKITHIG
jgi:hypothetical protein